MNEVFPARAHLFGGEQGMRGTQKRSLTFTLLSASSRTSLCPEVHDGEHQGEGEAGQTAGWVRSGLQSATDCRSPCGGASRVSKRETPQQYLAGGGREPL